MLLSSLIIKSTPVCCVASVAGVGAGLAYYSRDSIHAWFVPTEKIIQNPLYIAVKNISSPTATLTPSTRELTSTIDATINKNYTCLAKISGQDVFDHGCSLIEFHSTNTTPKTINLTSNYLNKKPVNTKAEIASSGLMALAISQEFKDKLSLNTEIRVVDKNDFAKDFAALSYQFDLTKFPNESRAELKSNLFLYRVTAQAADLTIAANKKTFKCSIDKKSLDCNVYKTTAKNDSNNLTNADLSKLAAIDKDSTAVGKYIVVEIPSVWVTSDTYKNKPLTINADESDSSKTITAAYDQILFGKVSTTLTSSKVYPATPKLAHYIVKNASDSSGFLTTINSEDATKNYFCKFGADTKENRDSSCTLKVFPALTAENTKIHTFESIIEQTNFAPASNSNATDKTHFLLSVDGNKLFNLNTLWTDTNPEITLVTSTEAAKTLTLAPLQEVQENLSIGKTNLALVQYKSEEAVTTTADSGKCSFIKGDTTTFDCKFRKATVAQGTTDFVGTTFASDDETSFTANDYFALVLTAHQPISTFLKQNQIFRTEGTGESAKTLTFDIISLIGGDVTSGKIAYFLKNSSPVVSAPSIPAKAAKKP